MRVTRERIPDVLKVELDAHRDERGFFVETFHAERYASAGICKPFVQDNHSRSTRGTIRGLHYQLARPQAKLIRVIVGEIFDVAVDIRRGSPTFGQWVGVHLSAQSFTQYYIPEGFAHGFSVLSDVAEVEYKCTDLYDPSGQLGIAWNDPTLGITWQVDEPTLSGRDRQHPPLHQAPADHLPVYRPTEA